jgi:hypothetical protein
VNRLIEQFSRQKLTIKQTKHLLLLNGSAQAKDETLGLAHGRYRHY